MKIQWNKKYSSVTIYSCIMIAFTVACVFLAVNLNSAMIVLSRFVDILSPLIVGFIIAYLINPFMLTCEKYLFGRIDKQGRWKTLVRVLSIALSYLFYSIVLGLLLWLVIPQVGKSYNDLIARMDTYLISAQNFIDSLFENTNLINAEKIRASINLFLGNSYNLVFEITPYITDFLGGFIVKLRDAVIGIVISVYFLYSKERLIARTKKIVYALFPKKFGDVAVEYANFTDKTFGNFIIGKILDSAIIGILSFIVFALVRMPHYQLVSVIVGVTNVIPFFGPIIGAIPCAFIVFIAEPGKTILFLILILAIQQIDGNVIGPKILGDSIGISSLGVIVAITVMSGLLGVLGMFIGVPLYVLIISIAKRIVLKIEQTRKENLMNKELKLSAEYIYQETEVSEQTKDGDA